MPPCRLRLALLLAGLLLWPGLAEAQTPAAPPAGPAPARPAALAPAQARDALVVLRDEKRRAELITTLEAIAATGATAPAGDTPPAGAGTAPVPATAAPDANGPAAASAGAAAPATKLPLEPNSLAAQIVTQASTALAAAGSQLVASLQSVNDLPLLWRWIHAQATDPDARALLFDAFWKLGVVAAAALGLEWSAARLLRRVRAILSQRAQSRPAPPPPPDMPEPEAPTDAAAPGTPEAAAAQDEHERTARARRLTSALGALRRLPYLLARLGLDLIPIAAFAALANVLLGTGLGVPATTRGTILVVVQSYVAARLIVAATTLLVSPANPTQRLLHISEWGAAFLTRWIRRLSAVALAGYAVANVGLQFEMYRTAYDTLLKLFALTIHVGVVVAILQAREPVARRLRARRGRTGAWAAVQNKLAETWHLVAIFYVMALWLVWAIELRNGYVRLVRFFLITGAVTTTARLLAVVLLGGLDRARVLPSLATRMPGFEARANYYFPFLRSLVLGAIGVAAVVALLEGWGFDVVRWFEQSGLGGRSLSAIGVIAATGALAVLVWEGVNSSIELQLARLTGAGQLARAGRLRTLLPMLRTMLLMAIVLVVALETLSELGVNIAPLLAGAGVIGIAVGFGSQKLVQDLITGLFLLLENAMQVGDVVTLGGLSGTVEALSIRTIRLRALDGSIHIIPFSAVTTVTNQTRDYSYALLDVSIGLNEQPDRVIEVLKEAADAMRQEPRWQSLVIEPLDVMGVERFIDLAWVLRVRMKTQPASRWAVARELNRRFKLTFDRLGIESPFTSHRALSDPPAAGPEEAQNDKLPHPQLDRSAAE